MVPHPEPVEPRVLGGDGSRPHVAIARTHRDEQDIGLHGPPLGTDRGLSSDGARCPYRGSVKTCAGLRWRSQGRDTGHSGAGCSPLWRRLLGLPRTASLPVGGAGSRNSLVEGRLSALHPPPSALTTSAAATIRRPRIATAVISLLKAVACATMTLR